MKYIIILTLLLLGTTRVFCQNKLDSLPTNIYFNGKQGGDITKPQALANRKIIALNSHNDKELTVLEFTIAFAHKYGGNIYFEKTYGNEITDASYKKLGECMLESMFVLAGIIVECKETGKKYVMNGTTFRIVEIL